MNNLIGWFTLGLAFIAYIWICFLSNSVSNLKDRVNALEEENKLQKIRREKDANL